MARNGPGLSTRQEFALTGLILVVAVALFADAAAAQSSVATISTREATRATASTGFGGGFGVPPSNLAAPLNVWPAPNGGLGWGTVGTNLSSPLANTLAGHYEPSGWSSATTPAPVYRTDTLGNITYVNPANGLAQTFGTTIQKVRVRR
jgi:hypothetical protein